MTDLYETQITQQLDELDPFIGILLDEDVRKFIEIGSRFGGSLWRIGIALPTGSTIVSVDSGKGMGGNKPGAQDSLKRCVAALRGRGYDAHLIIGDSHHPDIIKRAHAICRDYDAAFIDGDHTLEGVSLDWEHYGKRTRVCGFHDVAWEMPAGYSGKLCDCKAFWDVISKRFPSQTQTFVHPGGNMGIGVVWLPR